MVAGSISTIIFDLDGTLLYTLEDLTDSVNYALSNLGYPKRSIDEIRTFVGNGIMLLIERALPAGKNNPDYDKCLNIFIEHYSTNMFSKTKPYDGIISMLSTLKQENYKIGVVSNKHDSAVNELVKTYFKGLVDIAIGQQYNLKPKPAPDGIIMVINKLKVSKEECIIIGDSEVDIETANNIGIPCLSVTWGYKTIDFLYEHGATTFVYTPEDILEII